MTRLSHFKARCRERGLTCVDLDQLCADLEASIASGNSAFTEHVMQVPGNEANIWRFRVECGTFYALTKQGNLVTLLTQDHIRTVKALRRGDAGSIKDYNWDRMISEVTGAWKERRLRKIKSPKRR